MTWIWFTVNLSHSNPVGLSLMDHRRENLENVLQFVICEHIIQTTFVNRINWFIEKYDSKWFIHKSDIATFLKRRLHYIFRSIDFHLYTVYVNVRGWKHKLMWILKRPKVEVWWIWINWRCVTNRRLVRQVVAELKECRSYIFPLWMHYMLNYFSKKDAAECCGVCGNFGCSKSTLTVASGESRFSVNKLLNIISYNIKTKWHTIHMKHFYHTLIVLFFLSFLKLEKSIHFYCI